MTGPSTRANAEPIVAVGANRSQNDIGTCQGYALEIIQYGAYGMK